MTGFSQTFLGKELHQIAGLFTPEYEEAVKLLHASIDAVANEINTHGPDLVKAVVSAAALAASAAKAAGADNSAAGKAALAAAESAALEQAATLGKDALHAIVTSTVSSA